MSGQPQIGRNDGIPRTFGRGADLFGGFADEGTLIQREVAVNSRGGTAMEDLGNVNADGMTITSTEQALNNFWNWFGFSEAVDDDGRPLVMYHSTNGDVDRFEPGRKSTNNYGLLGDVEVSRSGIFMTPERDFSQEYLRDGHGQNVMQLYLRAENPLDLRNGLTERQESALEDAGIHMRRIHVQNHWELFDNDDEGKNDLVEALKKLGYDSAVFYETGRDELSHVTWVAFSPDQVKSALGNNGLYAADSGSMTDHKVMRSVRRDLRKAQDLADQMRAIAAPSPSERMRVSP